MSGIDVFIAGWLVVSVLTAAGVTYDAVRNQPAIIPIMKVAWGLITLYMGPIGAILYLTSCREPSPGTHERYVAAQWKQTIGSAVHCVAGDAIGIAIVAAILSFVEVRWWWEFSLEYVAAFITGWLLFQAVAMGRMMGGFRKALTGAFVAEAISLTAMVAGMFPTMFWLMGMSHEGHSGTRVGPGDVQFWGAMSAAVMVGLLVTYPVNWWLVASGRKHGMASSMSMGHGGHAPHPGHGMPAEDPEGAPA
jgi:hypothetical protein